MTTSFPDILIIASFSLGLFGAAFCYLQERDVWSFRTLGLVLLLSSVSELNDVPFPIATTTSAENFEIISLCLWIMAIVMLAPLFWHYVCTLTSVTPKVPKRWWLHAILPAMGALVAIFVTVMPHDARLGLLVDGYDVPTGWPLLVGYFAQLLLFAAVVQWGGYFVAIIMRLRRYRGRLPQFVASTERKELTWIWMISLSVTVYWVVSAIDIYTETVHDRAFVTEAQDDLLALILLLVIMLFGLQQRPGLAPDVAPAETAKKYEKSALTPDISKRIERKLRHAMTNDALHHDPNLSLWTLAKHIGASPNYVSQTLNDEIGESFFDFVNGYRIADAQTRLRASDETVLAIAYEVGFNSRSSFYTAFSKVTGQTPSAYRQTVSVSA
ncbi:MAG: AraC family transcriptional regulator [Pseudomonadota bacterium]